MQIKDASPAGLSEALSVLESGGVVAHATETCYGLACDLTNPKAVRRLFKLKERDFYLPVSALFLSVEQAEEYTDWNERAQELSAMYLPGPLTLILHLKKNPPFVLYPVPGSGLTIGVRISAHPVASQLVARFEKPLSTTSANIHALPPPYSAEEIIDQFKGRGLKPDLILNSGQLPKVSPSTVIDLTGGAVKTVREGSQRV